MKRMPEQRQGEEWEMGLTAHISTLGWCVLLVGAGRETYILGREPEIQEEHTYF